MAMRIALFTDIIGMAAGTLRANKLRAALTILGVVIGITAIVGMTSLIRGFDESIKDSIRELGPNTLFVAKFSGLSFASGKEFKDLVKRPVLTVADAKAIEREAPSAGKVDVWLGAWGMPGRERAYYKGEKTKELSVIGVSENYAAVNFLKLATRPVLHRVGGAAPPRRRGPRGHADAGALPERRPRRQDHPRGGRGVRGRRHGGEADLAVRRQRRPGRFPGRPVHDVPEAVRVAALGTGQHQRHA